MKKYIVKFFGSKNKREQIRQVKNMIVSASRATEVEDVLRHRYGYEVINGLKIREYNEDVCWVDGTLSGQVQYAQRRREKLMRAYERIMKNHIRK